MCNTCRKTKPEEAKKLGRSVSTTSRSSTPDEVPKVKQLRRRSVSRKSSASSETSTVEKKETEPTSEQVVEPPKEPSPFTQLIRAATIMNPKVFELPREFNIYPQFPGEDKRKS